jgi:hypothetical protein
VSDLKVGDKIRILKTAYWCAAVSAGDVLEAGWVSDEDFTADDWFFPTDGEGIGWEKVED